VQARHMLAELIEKHSESFQRQFHKSGSNRDSQNRIFCQCEAESINLATLKYSRKELLIWLKQQVKK
jgi:hypothetical protein